MSSIFILLNQQRIVLRIKFQGALSLNIALGIQHFLLALEQGPHSDHDSNFVFCRVLLSSSVNQATIVKIVGGMDASFRCVIQIVFVKTVD